MDFRKTLTLLLACILAASAASALPDDYSFHEPSDGEEFKVDESGGDTWVTLEYSIEANSDGNLRQMLNGFERSEEWVGADGTYNSQTTIKLDPGSYAWSMEFERASDGAIDTSDDFVEFTVRNPYTHVTEMNPSDETRYALDTHVTQDLDWEIDASDISSSDTYDAEIKVVDSDGVTQYEETNTYSGGETVQDSTTTGEIPRGNYDFRINTYYNGQLESSVSEPFTLEAPTYHYKEADRMEDTVDFHIETDYEASEMTFQFIQDGTVVHTEPVSTNPEQIDDLYKYTPTATGTENLIDGEIHEVRLSEVEQGGTKYNQDERISFIIEKFPDGEGEVFNLTEQTEELEIPDGVEAIEVELYGGAGHSHMPEEAFGRGGYTTAQFDVDPGQRLWVTVGGGAGNPFNGGGTTSHGDSSSGDGGGGTDIRFYDPDILENRILVAGGGGGHGSEWRSGVYRGGHGGGLEGGLPVDAEDKTYAPPGLQEYSEELYDDDNGKLSSPNNQFWKGGSSGTSTAGAGGGGWYGGSRFVGDPDDSGSYTSYWTACCYEQGGGAGGSSYILDPYASSANTVTGGLEYYTHGWASIEYIASTDEAVDTLPEEPQITFNIDDNYSEENLDFSFDLQTDEDGQVSIEIQDGLMEEYYNEEDIVYSEDLGSHSAGTATYNIDAGDDFLSGEHTIRVRFEGSGSLEKEMEKQIYYEPRTEGYITTKPDTVHRGQQYAVCYNPEMEDASQTLEVELPGFYNHTRTFDPDNYRDIDHLSRTDQEYCIYPEYEHASTGTFSSFNLYDLENDDPLIEDGLTIDIASRPEIDETEYDRVVEYTDTGERVFDDVGESVLEIEFEAFGARGGTPDKGIQSYGGYSYGILDVSDYDSLELHVPEEGYRRDITYSNTPVTYWTGGEAAWLRKVKGDNKTIKALAGGGGGSAKGGDDVVYRGGDGGSVKGEDGWNVDMDDRNGVGGEILHDWRYRSTTFYGSTKGYYDNSGLGGDSYVNDEENIDGSGEFGAEERPGGGGAGYCHEDVQNCLNDRQDDRPNGDGEIRIAFNYVPVVQSFDMAFEDEEPDEANFEVETTINKDFASAERTTLEIYQDGIKTEEVDLQKSSGSGNSDYWHGSTTLDNRNTDYSFEIETESDSGSDQRFDYTEKPLLEAEGFWGDGSGTSSDPYQIDSCYNLQHVRNGMNNNYELVESISCSMTEEWYEGSGFHPLGHPDDSAGDGQETFEGTLSGNNNTVSGLRMYRPEADNAAIFSKLKDAEIKNLNIENVQFTIGENNLGVLAGTIEGDTEIETMEVTGDIEAGSTGNIGNNFGTIAGVQESGTIINVEANHSIANAHNSGGIVGLQNSGSIEDSYSDINHSKTLGASGARVGGIVGIAEGKVEGVRSEGVIQDDHLKGGIAGVVRNGGEVRESFSRISHEGSNNAEGGVVGRVNGGAVEDTFSDSDARGGVVGQLYNDGNNLTESYSIRSTPIDQIRNSEESDQTIENVYWNTDTSGESTDGFESTEGLTDTEMRDESNFNNFDFTEVWETRSQNDDYPALQRFDTFYEPPQIVDISHPDEIETEVEFQLSATIDHPEGEDYTVEWSTGHTGETVDVSLNETGDRTFWVEARDGRQASRQYFRMRVICIEREECSDIPAELRVIEPQDGDLATNESVYFDFEVFANDGQVRIYDSPPSNRGYYTRFSETHERGEGAYNYTLEFPEPGTHDFIIQHERDDDGETTTYRGSYEVEEVENTPPTIDSVSIPDTVDEGQEFEVSATTSDDEYPEELTHLWQTDEHFYTGNPRNVCFEESGTGELTLRVYDPYDSVTQNYEIDVQSTGQDCYDSEQQENEETDTDEEIDDGDSDRSDEEEDEPKTDIETEFEFLDPIDGEYLTTTAVMHEVNVTANRGTLDMYLKGDKVASFSQGRGSQVHSYYEPDIETGVYNWKLEYTREADGKVVESPVSQYYVEEVPDLGDGDGDEINESDSEDPDREDGDVNDDGEIDYPSTDIAYYEDGEIHYEFSVNHSDTGDVRIIQSDQAADVEDHGEEVVFDQRKDQEGEQVFEHSEPIEGFGFYYYQIEYETDLGFLERTDVYSIYVDTEEVNITLEEVEDRNQVGELIEYEATISSLTEGDVTFKVEGEVVGEDFKDEFPEQSFNAFDTADEFGSYTYSVTYEDELGTHAESGSFTVGLEEDDDDDTEEDDGSGGDGGGDDGSEEDDDDLISPTPGDGDEDDTNDTETGNITGTIEVDPKNFSAPNGETVEDYTTLVNTMENDTIVTLQVSESCDVFDFRGLDSYRDSVSYEVAAAESVDVPLRVQMPEGEEQVSCDVGVSYLDGGKIIEFTADNEFTDTPELLDPIFDGAEPLTGAFMQEQSIQICQNFSAYITDEECLEPDTLAFRPATLMGVTFLIFLGAGYARSFYRRKYKGEPVSEAEPELPEVDASPEG